MGSRLLAISRRCRGVAILGTYLFLVFWSTWPLLPHARHYLAAGSLKVGTVPLLNVWTIWWNADQLRQGYPHYWDAPIFFPARETFALSEPQPVTILVAPVIWLTGERVLAYNIYLWLSLFLNGVFTERLLRSAGIRRWPAVAGGGAMILLPIVHWQLEVVQLVPLWPVLWTCLACLRWGRAPDFWHGVQVGLSSGTAFLTCGHQGLFLFVLLAGSFWILQRRWLTIRTWVTGAIAVAVTLAMTGPVIWHLKNALGQEDFSRDPELVTQLSATVGDYTATTGVALINPGQLAARTWWGLTPGWLKVFLAIPAITIGLIRRQHRRWTLFLLTLGTLAFCLSLGPNLRIAGWQPWWTLTAWCPGFRHVRNVFRFAFFVQMVAVLLAAEALHFLLLMNRWFWRNMWARRVTELAIFGIAGLTVIEIRPASLDFSTAPDHTAHAGWIDYVRDHTPPGQGILCLPLPAGEHVNQFEISSRWMFCGTYHKVPLFNGYSGHFPAHYYQIQLAANVRFPTDEILDTLVKDRVETLVVDRTQVAVDGWNQSLTRYELELVLEDDPSGIEIYRIRPQSATE